MIIWFIDSSSNTVNVKQFQNTFIRTCETFKLNAVITIDCKKTELSSKKRKQINFGLLYLAWAEVNMSHCETWNSPRRIAVGQPLATVHWLICQPPRNETAAWKNPYSWVCHLYKQCFNIFFIYIKKFQRLHSHDMAYDCGGGNWK